MRLFHQLAQAAASASLFLPAILAQGESESGYWHEQYHGLLSMAAYGDYLTTCPQKFTQDTLLDSFPDSVEAPFTLLQVLGPTTDGLKGFLVQVPEMDKVVLVFGGLYGWESMDHSSVDIGHDLHLDCDDCKAHGGAVRNYLELKEQTSDWTFAIQAAETSGHEFSITGHGFGGMVGLVAALDLGWKGAAHWSHAHGTPRTFNLASAKLYESLYTGEAGQNTIANNDPVPHFIPRSDDYVHPLSGVYIWGDGHNDTYGMNWRTCMEHREDPDCQGNGSNADDHYFYYTPIGQCGQSPYYFPNQTQVDSVIALEENAFAATAVADSTLPATPTFSASNVAEPMSVTGSGEPSGQNGHEDGDEDDDDEDGSAMVRGSAKAWAIGLVGVTTVWVVV